MRGRSLKLRIVLIVSSMVLASGVTVAALAAFHYGKSLEKIVRARAGGIALGLSLQVADLVLINDRVTIQRLLESERSGNRDIAYIFLVRRGEVLAHTFDAGVPAGLMGPEFNNAADQSKVRNVVSPEGRKFIDVTQSIFGGEAGVLRLGLDKSVYLQQLRSLWYEIALLTLLVLAASIAVCLLFARQLARPLESLVKAIKGLSTGDLTTRVSRVGGVREVDELAVSFNSMADTIAEYTGKLEAQAEDLEHAQQQARLSCGIIQEVGGLSTLEEIGGHLSSRLLQILRCREIILVLGYGQKYRIFKAGSQGGSRRNLHSPWPVVMDRVRDSLQSTAVREGETDAAGLGKIIGPFQRAGVVPVHNQGRFLGMLVSVCRDAVGCQECEGSLAETILRQASGSIWRVLREHEDPDESGGTAIPGLVGKAPVMARLARLIGDVAPTDSTVLLLGESGTGKEVVARAIHRASPRKDKPFVVIDCSAYPATLLESELFGHEKGAFTGALRRKKGRFEQAQGGTVFLDEIGDIPLSAQVKLLRVSQIQQLERLGGEETLDLDVRILAATNKDLVEMVKQGGFREDLFYRLNVFSLTLPPLRERVNDVPLLARYFLGRFNQEQGKSISEFSDQTMRILMDHDWPGNVRELENLVERAVILAKGEEIEPWDLPAYLRTAPPAAPMSLDTQEKSALEAVLDQCDWNKKEAAKHLGISRTTLYRKIKKHGLEEPTKH